jgi:hypothetical protein
MANQSIVVPRPNRIRRIGPFGFGWLDARLHRHGWLEILTPEDIAMYAFLCLAADKQGVSWYRLDMMQKALGLSENQLRKALKRLYTLDLVSFRPFRKNTSDGFHQVLSLPAGGPPDFFP